MSMMSSYTYNNNNIGWHWQPMPDDPDPFETPLHHYFEQRHAASFQIKHMSYYIARDLSSYLAGSFGQFQTNQHRYLNCMPVILSGTQYFFGKGSIKWARGSVAGVAHHQPIGLPGLGRIRVSLIIDLELSESTIDRPTKLTESEINRKKIVYI